MVKRDKYGNCAQCVYFNFLTQKDNDPSLLYLTGNCLYFDDDSNKMLGHRINLYSKGYKELDECMRICYGYVIKWNKNISTNMKKMIIDGSLEKNIGVVIVLDSFFCNWQSGYLKRHSEHVIQVIKHIGNNYLCVDPYCSKEEQLIDEKSVIEGSFSVGIIKKAKKEEKDFTIEELIGFGRKKELFARIIDAFKNKKILDEELDSADIIDIELIKRINHISLGRKAFSLFLQSCGLDNLSKQSTTISKLWSNLCINLIKYKSSGFSEEDYQKLIITMSRIGTNEIDMDKRLEDIKKWNILI